MVLQFYKHENPDGTLHTFEHGMAEHLAQSRRERDQRRLENHLRTFYDLWRRGELRDEDMDDDSEYEDSDEDGWSADEGGWDDDDASDLEAGQTDDEDDFLERPHPADQESDDEEVDDEDDAAYQRDLARAIALSQREAGLDLTDEAGQAIERAGQLRETIPSHREAPSIVSAGSERTSDMSTPYAVAYHFLGHTGRVRPPTEIHQSGIQPGPTSRRTPPTEESDANADIAFELPQ